MTQIEALREEVEKLSLACERLAERSATAAAAATQAERLLAEASLAGELGKGPDAPALAKMRSQARAARDAAGETDRALAMARASHEAKVVALAEAEEVARRQAIEAEMRQGYEQRAAGAAEIDGLLAQLAAALGRWQDAGATVTRCQARLGTQPLALRDHRLLQKAIWHHDAALAGLLELSVALRRPPYESEPLVALDYLRPAAQAVQEGSDAGDDAEAAA